MTKNKTNTLVLRFFAAILFLSSFLLPAQRICILIPAYNEQDRIGKTLCTYAEYFKTKPEKVTFLVVANGCSKDDKTVEITKTFKKTYKNIKYINLVQGGKGYALKEGFLWALKKPFDLIGFVDADMATLPEYFYDLIVACNEGYDGANASRYAKGAKVYPERPLVRLIGGKLYNWVLRKRFGFNCKDTQCGAKIFTYDTIAKVAPEMQETGWSWELEFFYLCQLEGKKIKEVPTVWNDQPGSHLEISTKIIKEFTSAPSRIKQRHAAKKKASLQQQQVNNGLKASSGIFGNLSKAFKQSSTEYKALATVQATIDTYGAANAAYKSAAEIPVVGPVLAPIAAGAAVVAGAAGVAGVASFFAVSEGLLQPIRQMAAAIGSANRFIIIPEF